MNTDRYRWIALLVLLSACDETTPAVDAAVPADAGSPDAGGGPECAFPARQIAGTPETDAVASAAARCGQSAHAWLDDDMLGTVASSGPPMRYGVAILRGLVEGAGVTLPRDPEQNVALREFRYITQDRGELVETTATVAYPESATPGEVRDTILFLHGTSGFTAGCGPSEDETGLLAALLASYGYVVVMPDFLGLEFGDASYGELHPYLVGQATAIASLDAVRAATRLSPADRGGVCMAPRVVTFGGSQGGHAALWVDRLMPYYARELEHLGVVATVPPADLYGEVVRGLSELVDASANVGAMYATMPLWYGFEDRLSEVFVPPLDTELVPALRAACSPDSFDGVTGLGDVYTTTMLDAATDGSFGDLDPWACMARENGLTTTSIPRISEDADGFGILYVLGEDDPLVHTPIEREAFRALCEANLPLSYLECAGAGHGNATYWSLPEILDFLDARAAGETFVASACEPAAPVTCRGTPAP